MMKPKDQNYGPWTLVTVDLSAPVFLAQVVDQSNDIDVVV